MRRLTAAILLACCMLAALAASAQCRVIYVNSARPDDSGDGFTWDTARKTVTAGISASADGDEIWVARGTYIGCITLKVGTGLYGGFSGIETDKNQRNARANITILDGNAKGSVVTPPNGATSTTIIDGFTIQHGSASGIYCYYSSPTITNNIITANKSAQDGGGIYCLASSSIIMNNCIASNDGRYGGGIASIFSLGTAVNNVIVSNNSTEQGGGIYCFGSSLNIKHNVIKGNSAKSIYGGGGIYCLSIPPPIIANNLIAGNYAPKGGGIRCVDSSPVITNNTIASNGYGDGGGILCVGTSKPPISNNVIALNTSGVYADGMAVPVLRNNDVYNPGGYNYSGLTAGTGDISIDPGFASIQYGNYHIQPGSGCIDSGWNDASSIGTIDIDGQARIAPEGGAVDIGADESDGKPWNAAPVVVRVDGANGSDTNDGSSWALAKKTMQAAIDTVSISGGEVWAKAGTYKELISLKLHSHVYGGFAGTESAKDARDWTKNKTVLDPGYNTPLDIRGAVNVYNIPSGLATIDGFEIRHGRSCIYCNNASIGISNNKIMGSADGGVYCENNSAPLITHNIFVGNFSCHGGGICCFSSSPTITDNTFTGNNGLVAAGIGCYNSSPVIANNTIVANYAGGISCYSSNCVITNNTIAGNASSYQGCVYISNCSPILSNNIIACNSTGIYCLSATPVLRNNDVYNPGGYNYSGLTAGTGDISADPLFVSRSSGNYHLALGSPCINTGRNDAQGIPPLDIDCQKRIQGGTVDMGVDEWWPGIIDAKQAAENSQIEISGAIVSAAFPDFFYIESSDRSCGIRVNKPAHGLMAGMRAEISGSLATNSDAERCINAASVCQSGTGSIMPMAMSNRCIGGGTFGYQPGVWGWVLVKDEGGKTSRIGAETPGISNIGLLITTCGKVTYADSECFYIDDGSGLDDNSGYRGVKVYGSLPADAGIDPTGKMVAVTGISSCERPGSNPVRVIRTRGVGDILIISN